MAGNCAEAGGSSLGGDREQDRGHDDAGGGDLGHGSDQRYSASIRAAAGALDGVFRLLPARSINMSPFKARLICITQHTSILYYIL